MAWLQLRLPVSADEVERFSDLLLDLGAAAVLMEDAEDQPLLEPGPGETPLWHNTIVKGLFEAEADMDVIQAQLRDAIAPATLPRCQIEQLEEKDWERAWMDNFHPIQFGKRLWICPSWHQPPDPTAINVMLDPGIAFGTGTHPTTALCLQWLDNQEVKGKTVVDYGCGSGILAIASALLGARHVWAIDYDPQALHAAAHNTRQNNVEAQITIGAPDALPEQEYDIILANILAKPLLELAPRFAGLLKPGGQLVLSGLLASQVTEVCDRYQAWFAIDEVMETEEWIRVSATRRP
jgi:ribosomal protein L11 methyltransferase